MSEDASRPGVAVLAAGPEEQALVGRLLELYIHDLSQYFAVAPKDNGLFGYPQLPLYWSEADRFPFLVFVDGGLAGFVLVRKLNRAESGAVWDVAEFFVLRGYRRQGAGRSAAHQVWQRLPGPWQVRVLKANRGAVEFWEQAIQDFAGDAFRRATVELDGTPWQVYSFVSGPSSGAGRTTR